MKKNDHYNENGIYMRIYHRASLISDIGVSALCYSKPRAINLKTHLWTTDDSAVTCKKCLQKMAENQLTSASAESRLAAA